MLREFSAIIFQKAAKLVRSFYPTINLLLSLDFGPKPKGTICPNYQHSILPPKGKTVAYRENKSMRTCLLSYDCNFGHKNHSSSDWEHTGPWPHNHREYVMMCWKRASADMQSLGKHVEGMIHLKLLRHWKQKGPFLPLLYEWEVRKQGNEAVYPLVPHPSHVSLV